MFEVGTKLLRTQTGQKYVIESIDRMKRIGSLFKKDTWYNLKQINGNVDLIVRADELKKLFTLIKQTNSERIRAMSDEELAKFLVNFKNTFGEEYEGEISCLDWLQSEADTKGE